MQGPADFLYMLLNLRLGNDILPYSAHPPLPYTSV